MCSLIKRDSSAALAPCLDNATQTGHAPSADQLAQRQSLHVIRRLFATNVLLHVVQTAEQRARQSAKKAYAAGFSRLR